MRSLPVTGRSLAGIFIPAMCRKVSCYYRRVSWPGKCSFFCQGILKIVSVNGKGNEVTQFFVKEDHFCTILNSFNNQVPAHESIKAACDTDLIVFPREQLWQLYTQLPYFQSLINQITQQTLLAKIQVRNSYMGEDAATRYQQFLQQQPDIALRVPLSDVASYLGITQQSLSRIRKQIR